MIPASKTGAELGFPPASSELIVLVHARVVDSASTKEGSRPLSRCRSAEMEGLTLPWHLATITLGPGNPSFHEKLRFCRQTCAKPGAALG
jgi:hypothetical protein